MSTPRQPSTHHLTWARMGERGGQKCLWVKNGGKISCLSISPSEREVTIFLHPQQQHPAWGDKPPHLPSVLQAQHNLSTSQPQSHPTSALRPPLSSRAALPHLVALAFVLLAQTSQGNCSAIAVHRRPGTCGYSQH